MRFLAKPHTGGTTGVKTGLACGDASAVELLSSESTTEIGLLLKERGMYSGDGEGASKISMSQSASMIKLVSRLERLPFSKGIEMSERVK